MRLQHYANKIWGVIFAIVMIGAIFVPMNESSMAQDSGSLESQMEQYMNKKLDNKLSGFKFSNLKIKHDEEINIYMVLFNELGVMANEKVLQSLSDQGYSDSAIGSLRNETSVQEDLSRAYESEREFYEQLVKHQNESLALEMFTNGSTNDGDFDLLKDLQKIENILFARNETGQLGPAIDRSNSGNRPEIKFQRQSVSSPVTNNGTDNPSESENESGVQDENEVTQPEESDDICQIDTDLAQELTRFIDENDEETIDQDSNTDDGEEESVSGGQDEGSSVGGNKSIGSFIKRDEECDEIFCFYTEEIYVTEHAYFPDDNGCIACVIENMAENMTELMSQSVYPRKVTGNFLEPSMCKGAFRNTKFDLSVTLVERPIFSSDPVESVTELSARSLVRNWLNNRNTEEQEAESEEAVEALLNLGGTDDITNLALRSSEVQEQVELDARIRSGMFPVSNDLASEAGLIQELHQRMNSMAIYFDSYNQILNNIQSSLTSLYSKPVCE